MVQNVYIIDESNEIKRIINNLFKNKKEYIFKHVTTSKVDIALKNIPDLIIINEDSLKENATSIYEKLNRNDDNRITPIMVVSSNIEKKHRVDTLKNGVDYYIKKPIDEEYFYYTIKNILELIHMNRTVSPLTGLPGNVQIQAEMKKRLLIGEPFSMMYLDIDNFKSYNDLYGFLKGDELIKFTAKILCKNIHKLEESSNFIRTYRRG